MNRLSRVLLVANLLLFVGLVGVLGYHYSQRTERAALDDEAVDRIIAGVEEKLERYRAEALRANQASRHTVSENMTAIRAEITATLEEALGAQEVKLEQLSSKQDTFVERYAAVRAPETPLPAVTSDGADGMALAMPAVPSSDDALVLKAAPVRPAVARALEPSAADTLLVAAAAKGLGTDGPATMPAVVRNASKPAAPPALQVAPEDAASDDQLAEGEKRKLAEIHFSHGSFDLSPGAREKAYGALAQFSELQASKVRVIGFTDTTGPADKNL